MTSLNQDNSCTDLPQGFSVYQPTLGAQLQFFPALGSQELDDMVNAFIYGPAPTREKRAAISLDFLEYAQATGQTFKFYPVYAASSPASATSSASVSPRQGSAASSFNVSPVNSSWDWSHASGAASVSSSHSSTHARRPSKAASPTPRHHAADFSHLPGMKIMTKDGMDVTNSASRGSKTKEQRDHAHLMRIIRACDSCRRKKIRCDPSHKKRSAPQPASQSTPKQSKRQRAMPQKPAAVVTPALEDVQEASFSPLLDFDPAFTFATFEDCDTTAMPADPWEEFVQYAPLDVENSYGSFVDTEWLLSSQSSSSSASPFKSPTPTSQQAAAGESGFDGANDPGMQVWPPQFALGDQQGLVNNYADFNLFSPLSSFSEDDRMIHLESTSTSLGFSPSQSPSTVDAQNGRLPDGPDGRVSQEAAIYGVMGDGNNSAMRANVRPALISQHSDFGPVVMHFPTETVVVAPDGGSHIVNSESTSPSICGSTSDSVVATGSPLEITPRSDASEWAQEVSETIGVEFGQYVSSSVSMLSVVAIISTVVILALYAGFNATLQICGYTLCAALSTRRALPTRGKSPLLKGNGPNSTAASSEPDAEAVFGKPAAVVVGTLEQQRNALLCKVSRHMHELGHTARLVELV